MAMSPRSRPTSARGCRGPCAARLLVREQSFQHADGAVKRRALALRRIAVPTAVLELLAQESVGQPIVRNAEVSAGPEDRAVDAGLGLAVEERPAVELVVRDVFAHELDGSAHALIGRIHAEILQHYEGE